MTANCFFRTISIPTFVFFAFSASITRAADEACPKEIRFAGFHPVRAVQEWLHVTGGLLVSGEIDGTPVNSVRGIAGTSRYLWDQVRALRADYRAHVEDTKQAWNESVRRADERWESVGRETAESADATRLKRDNFVSANATTREQWAAAEKERLSTEFTTERAELFATLRETRERLRSDYAKRQGERVEGAAKAKEKANADYAKWNESVLEERQKRQTEIVASYHDPQNVIDRDAKFEARLQKSSARAERWTESRRRDLERALLELNEKFEEREKTTEAKLGKRWEALKELRQIRVHYEWARKHLSWIAHNWEEIGGIMSEAKAASLRSRQHGLAAFQMDRSVGRFAGMSVRRLRQTQAAFQYVVVGMGGSTTAFLGDGLGYPVVYVVTAGRWVSMVVAKTGMAIAYGGVSHKKNEITHDFGEAYSFAYDGTAKFGHLTVEKISEAYRHTMYGFSKMGNVFGLLQRTARNYGWYALERAANGAGYEGGKFLDSDVNDFVRTTDYGLYAGGSLLNWGFGMGNRIASRTGLIVGATDRKVRYAANVGKAGVMWGGYCVSAKTNEVAGGAIQYAESGMRRLGRIGGWAKRKAVLAGVGVGRAFDSFIVGTANTVTTPAFALATLGWTAADQAWDTSAEVLRRVEYPAVRFTINLNVKIDPVSFGRVPVVANLVEKILEKDAAITKSGDEYGTWLTLHDRDANRESGRILVTTHRRKIILQIDIQSWFVQHNRSLIETLGREKTSAGEVRRAIAQGFLEMLGVIDGPTIETDRVSALLEERFHVETIEGEDGKNLLALYPQGEKTEEAAALGFLELQSGEDLTWAGQSNERQEGFDRERLNAALHDLPGNTFTEQISGLLKIPVAEKDLHESEPQP